VEHVQRLLSQFTLETAIPVLLLISMVLGFGLLLMWAQLSTKNSFDIVNFLRDDQGKESSLRAFGFIALFMHTAWVYSLILQKRDTPDHFFWYGLIWAGTPAITILAQRWGGNLPFSQAGSPPYQPNKTAFADTKPPEARP